MTAAPMVDSRDGPCPSGRVGGNGAVIVMLSGVLGSGAKAGAWPLIQPGADAYGSRREVRTDPVTDITFP
jgi:hypothetical protein